MPKPPSFAISGWLNQRGGFLVSKRKLFSTVRTEGSGAAGGLPAYIFSAYLTEESALLEDVPAELKKKCKYAVPRPPKETVHGGGPEVSSVAYVSSAAAGGATSEKRGAGGAPTAR